MKEWSVTSCCVRALLSFDGVGSTAGGTPQAVRGKRRLSDAVLKNITWGWSREGSVKFYIGVRLPLLCQKVRLLTRELHTLPFSGIWPEASLEPLGCHTFLSAIRVGNGNSKCSASTLWSTPPFSCCFISGLFVPSHIIKRACLSPGSPVISLWFSSLMYK